MPIHRIIIFAGLFLLAYIIISQVLVPAIRGTKLFPMFRRESKLKEEILDANQALHENELEDELEERRRALEAEQEDRDYAQRVQEELAKDDPDHPAPPVRYTDTSPHN